MEADCNNIIFEEMADLPINTLIYYKMFSQYFPLSSLSNQTV